MWEAYRNVAKRYTKLPLAEGRRLIAQAQAGRKKSRDELILRHVRFVMWRFQQKAYQRHLERHGDDMLAAAIPEMYRKVGTCNL